MGKCSMRNLNNKYATLIVSEKIGNLKIEYAMILRGNMIIYDILFDCPETSAQPYNTLLPQAKGIIFMI